MPKTSFRKNSDSPQLDSLNKSLYGLQIDLDVLANITADKASLEQEEFGESLFLFCLHLRYRSDSDKTTGPTAIAD
jgi:hypothetical protein